MSRDTPAGVAGLRIANGVEQISVPMRHNPLGYTFSYYLQSSRTIIDTGVPGWDSFSAFNRQIKEVGSLVEDLEIIIITHMHHDHVGLVEFIKERSDAKVFAYEPELGDQRDRFASPGGYYKAVSQELQLLGGGAFQQILSRFEEAFIKPSDKITVDVDLEDGQILDLKGNKLKIIWTPGHAREHICLLDEEKRLLYSGDHVLPKITSHISLHTWEKVDPLRDYLESLEKVENLPVDLVLPGHERPFTDIRNRVKTLQNHHKSRLNEVSLALKSGEHTVFQISALIHWDSRPWPLMDFWTKRMAASETYAHLIYLRNKDVVKEANRGGVLYYRLA